MLFQVSNQSIALRHVDVVKVICIRMEKRDYLSGFKCGMVVDGKWADLNITENAALQRFFIHKHLQRMV